MDYDDDMVTSLLPIYYLSLTVGLASSIFQGPLGNRKLIKGRFHWVYHIAFLAFHLFIISEAYIWKDKTQDNSQFDKRIVLFGIYTSLFISLVVLICHHLFRFGIHKTLIEIYTLDKRMTNFGIQIDHKTVFKNTTIITIFLVITAVWFTVINRESTQLKEIYFLALFFIEYMFTMAMKSQFCIFNVLLKQRFLALDTKLKEVINSTRNIATNKNKIILVKNVEKVNNDDMNLSPAANQLIILSEFHSKLYNISKRINLYYSVQILLITGKYFVEITATLYFNLRKIYKDIEGQNKFDYYAIAHFIWAVMNAIDLLILVYGSDSMCTAANNSKLTLHKVNLNSKDADMKKEVTAFSLQLLHNDLVLTAAGFFNIDFTLIFNIIGAVTTYLVIFIQFDLNSTLSTSNSTSLFDPNITEPLTRSTNLLDTYDVTTKGSSL